MSVITLHDPQLTSFRKGHNGVDVYGSFLESDAFKFVQLSEFDFKLDFHRRASLLILHAKRHLHGLVPARDYTREAKGLWSGYHFHLVMSSNLAGYISPVVLMNQLSGTRSERMLMAPICELMLPKGRRLVTAGIPDVNKIVAYFEILMDVERPFALDNGVERVYGYEKKLWYSSFKFNKRITFSFLIRDYLARAINTRDVYEARIPFLRRLDLAFQYGTNISLNVALGAQERRYQSRIARFKSLGGLYGDIR